MCLLVDTYQSESRPVNFRENSYLENLPKFVDTFKILLKSGKNARNLHEGLRKFIISRSKWSSNLRKAVFSLRWELKKK